MAKKKKKKKKGKRSRMSGFGNLTNQLAIVAGVVGGAYADKLIQKIPGVEGMNKYVVPGAKVAVGLVVPHFIKGKYKSVAESFGGGLAGVGALNLLSEAGMLSGANDPLIVDLSDDGGMNEDVLGSLNDLGVMNEDVLGNAGDLSVMNGMY